MVSETKSYFNVNASTSQQAPGKIAFDNADTPWNGGGSGQKYQDVSSIWAQRDLDYTGWPSTLGDGDTTDPASDDASDTFAFTKDRDTSSSDEESERQRPQPPRNIPLPSFQSNAAKKQPARRELPEEGLIDIEPEEGIKRGGELMAMLTMFQDAAANPVLPVVRPADPLPAVAILSKDAPEFRPPAAASSRQQPSRQHVPSRQQAQQCWAATWEGPATANGGWGSERTTPEKVEPPRLATLVRQAAQDAFGTMLKEVVVANDGYMVLLHENMRQYEEVPVLQVLSRTLWPMLGWEVLSLEPSMAPAGHQRLNLEMKGKESQGCWEFSQTGACPRGSRCRWEHESKKASNTTTYIDIVY